jgi:hypothetical protein
MAEMLSYVRGILDHPFEQIFSDEVIKQYNESYFVGMHIVTGRLLIEQGRSQLQSTFP